MLRGNNSHKLGNNHKSRLKLKQNSLKFIKDTLIIEETKKQEVKEIQPEIKPIIIKDEEIIKPKQEVLNKPVEEVKENKIIPIKKDLLMIEYKPNLNDLLPLELIIKPKEQDLNINLVYDDIYKDKEDIPEPEEIYKKPIPIKKYNSYKFKSVVYSAMSNFYKSKEWE